MWLQSGFVYGPADYDLGGKIRIYVILDIRTKPNNAIVYQNQATSMTLLTTPNVFAKQS